MHLLQKRRFRETEQARQEGEIAIGGSSINKRDARASTGAGMLLLLLGVKPLFKL